VGDPHPLSLVGEEAEHWGQDIGGFAPPSPRGGLSLVGEAAAALGAMPPDPPGKQDGVSTPSPGKEKGIGKLPFRHKDKEMI